MRFLSCFSLFVFLLFTSISVLAQGFAWREPGLTTCYKIDFDAKRLLVSNEKGEWVDLGDVNFVDVKPADLYTSSDAINPIHIKGKVGTYLILECSGQVYHFSLPTKTLSRVDLTYYRGANCQAAQFARNDTLYSFGGYGFWQSTNILTQFNWISKDWTHILAKGDIPKALNKKSAVYLPELDRFISIGARRINQTESAELIDFDYSIYDYQFDDKSFKRIGEVHEPLLKELMSGETSNFMLALGRYIIISPKHDIPGYNHDLLYIIDVKDSFKGYLWTNPARFQIRKFMEERGITYSVFVRGNSIYLPQSQETFPYGSYHVVEVPINTLLKESTPLGPIMDKPLLATARDFAIIVFVTIVILFILRFLISIKRRNKKRQLHMLLGPNEKQFLDFLRLNYRQGYVSGHQIVAFFGKHKSSPESQRQFRAKLIEGLNKSLGLIFPGEQVLDIQADDKDQRMLTYRLTESIYQALKKL